MILEKVVTGGQNIWVLSLTLSWSSDQIGDRYIFFTTMRNLKGIGPGGFTFCSNLDQQVNNFQIEVSRKDYCK